MASGWKTAIMCNVSTLAWSVDQYGYSYALTMAWCIHHHAYIPWRHNCLVQTTGFRMTTYTFTPLMVVVHSDGCNCLLGLFPDIHHLLLLLWFFFFFVSAPPPLGFVCGLIRPTRYPGLCIVFCACFRVAGNATHGWFLTSCHTLASLWWLFYIKCTVGVYIQDFLTAGVTKKM